MSPVAWLRKSASTQFALSNVVAQGIVAISYVLAARSGTAKDFGVAVGTVGLCATMANLINFGSNTYLLRELAADRISIGDFQSRLIAKAGLAVAVGGCGACLASVLGRGGFHSAVILWLVPSMAVSQMIVVPLMAKTQLALAGSVVLADKLVSFSILILLLNLSPGSGPESLLIGLCAGPIAATLLALWLGPQQLRLLSKPTCRVWKFPWRGGTSFGVGSLAVSFQPLDVYAVELASSPQASGEYGVVRQWSQPFLMLASSFARARFPFWSGAPDPKLARRDLGTKLVFASSSIPACLALALGANSLVDLLVGPAYSNSAVVFQLMCATIPFLVFNQFLHLFVQSQGGARFAAFAIWVSVCIQFLILFAGHELGARAGALGNLFGQSSLTILCILWIIQYLPIEATVSDRRS